MSTYIFLRHGHSLANAEGRLTGRLPGVALSRSGQRDAINLIDRIGAKRIDHLYLSPIERCQLTIDPWLRSKNSSSLISLGIVDGFTELDFGEWSGRKLSSLRREPLWRDIQSKPSTVTFPGGESFRKAQRRAVAAFEEVRAIRGKEKVHLIVSHSDTIKLIIADSLGMKLDNFQSLTINPASFTVFSGDSKRLSMVAINSSATLKELLT